MIWLISKRSQGRAVSLDWAVRRAGCRTMWLRLMGLMRGVDPRWGVETIVVSKATGQVVRTEGERKKAGRFLNAGRSGGGSGRARLYL